MPDQNKKIVIPADQLPNLFFFRYRIATEDKNKYSHWSKIYFVEKEEE
jgi:hypothetical protein